MVLRILFFSCLDLSLTLYHDLIHLVKTEMLVSEILKDMGEVNQTGETNLHFTRQCMVDSFSSLHKGQKSKTKIFLIAKLSLTGRASLHARQRKCLTLGGVFKDQIMDHGKEGGEGG